MVKIENLSVQPSIGPTFAPGEAETEAHAGQVIPAASMQELVHTEIAAITDQALTETMEDIGFALGSRIMDGRRAEGKSDTQQRTKAMLYQLVNQVTAVAQEQLDKLLGSFSGLDSAVDPWAQLKQAGLDAGQMALILASLLADKNLTGLRRKRLEDALARVMEEDNWELMLFSRLEFGTASAPALQQLKQLYQRASARQTRLAQWFNELRHMLDRKRKLKTLIRTLAFELSAQASSLVKEHLVSVITDLKRIIQFLAFEDHCDHIAKALASPAINGERIMAELLEIVDQSWLFPDWIRERITLLGLEGPLRYSYTRRVAELIRLLPDECFREDAQRETIGKAFTEYLDQLADAE